MKPFYQPHRTALYTWGSALIVAGCAQSAPAPEIARAPQAKTQAKPRLAQVADDDTPQMTLEDLQGENPAQPLPQGPLPMEFVPRVWLPGETGHLTIRGAKAPMRLTVADYSGKIVWRGEAKAGDSTVDVGVSSLGFYTLRAGETPATEAASVDFAVVPTPKTVADISNPGRLLFGVNTHFGSRDIPDGGLDNIKKMGVDFVRDEAGWHTVEKEIGAYRVFPRHEEYTAALAAAGIPLLLSLSYGNEIYPGNVGRYPGTPQSSAAFGRYAAEALRRYGKAAFALEIFNEPNGLAKPDLVKNVYLPSLEAAHDEVRKAGFKQEIIAVGGAGPVGGGVIPGFAGTLYQNGGAKYSDSFSQHPYMAPNAPDAGYPGGPPRNNANVDLALDNAANLVKKYDLSGSWITETGWPAPFPNYLTEAEIKATGKPQMINPMVSLEKQAAFTSRLLLECSKYPTLKGVTIYDWQDDGPDPLKRENNFGIVRQDMTPKPAYQAFAVTADFLKGKTFAREVSKTDSIFRANLYTAPDGHVWAAVWTSEVPEDFIKDKNRKKAELPYRYFERDSTALFDLKGATANATSYDWQGQPIDARELQPSYLTATNLPMFLDLGVVNPKSVQIGAR